MKMENNAMISLKSIQVGAGEGTPNQIELQTRGRFAERNGKFYIIYEETELTGFEDTTTTIRVSPDSVSMTRNGKYSSKMVFRKGEKKLCSYNTPFGAIPVRINPILLDYRLSSDGGDVKIDYLIDMDNQDYWKNSLELTVTRIAD